MRGKSLETFKWFDVSLLSLAIYSGVVSPLATRKFEAQSYTKEDWDTIRAKLEVNAELKESVLGKDLSVEDYEKRMVELNQGTWKLTQLNNLNFEEVKAEFEKLIKQLDTYVPMNLESTKEKEKVEEDKDDKPTKKTGKRRKQIARKGLHTDLDKDNSEDSDEASGKDDSTSGRKGVYQIVKENGAAKVYISFGAMLTDISRDDLTELYRILMRKHAYRVHCLNLESVDIYMLIERKYPLSAEVCKAMLDKKLQGGKPDEDCYKMLKMIDKHKDWLVQEQMALGKDFSNPLMADSLPKIVWLSTHHISKTLDLHPLTQEMLSKMLSKKLEVDHENEMAFELLREITSLWEDCWELNVYILSTVNTEFGTHMVSAIVSATSSSKASSRPDSKLNPGVLDSSRLSVLKSFPDDQNSRSVSLKGVNSSLVELLVMHYLKQGINNQWDRHGRKKTHKTKHGSRILKFRF
ncbi:hypothetical protein Tco_1245973 [Tanacetum coccineum]